MSATVLLALVLLTACAPAAPSPAAPAAPQPTLASAPPTAPATSQPPPPARLSELDPGLVIGLAIIRAGVERTAALASGGAQVMLGTAEDVVRAVEQEVPLRTVAAVLNGTTYNIVAQPQYGRLADLRGGTIGVVDLTSGSTVVLYEIMRANGLEVNRDYQVRTVGGAAERATALRAGVIAATTLPVPDSTRLFEEGYANLGDAADYIPEYQNSPIAVRGARGWTRRRCGG